MLFASFVALPALGLAVTAALAVTLSGVPFSFVAGLPIAPLGSFLNARALGASRRTALLLAFASCGASRR